MAMIEKRDGKENVKKKRNHIIKANYIRENTQKSKSIMWRKMQAKEDKMRLKLRIPSEQSMVWKIAFFKWYKNNKLMVIYIYYFLLYARHIY